LQSPRLIREARRLFAQWQEKTEPELAPLEEFLRDALEGIWAEAETKSADSDAVLAQGLPLALHLLGQSVESTATGLQASNGAARVRIEFANQRNMNSLVAVLKSCSISRLTTPVFAC